MADIIGLVSETSANTIDVVDLTTSTVITSLSVSSPGEIATLPDGSIAYVTNNSGIPGNVYPVNLPAYSLGSTIVVGTEPFPIVASPDGTHVYTGSNGGADAGDITPIATPSNVAGSNVPLSGTANITGLAVNPASSILYAVTPFNGIYPIAIPAMTVGSPFGAAQLGSNNPRSMAIMPSGASAYVGSGNSGIGVWPVNLTAMTVGTPITTTATFPSQVYLTPDGTQLFVLDTGSNQVIVIDTATNTQTHAISMSPHLGDPNTGGFNLDGTMFYFTDESDGVVLAIDVATYALTTVASGLTGPTAISIVPSAAPPTPTTFDIPQLFIPRKPIGGFTDADHMINYRTIERWALQVKEILGE
jgi:YVTN family beta-propeller protein